MNADVDVALKIAAIACAIGLDVFAVSMGIGIAGVPWPARWRLGASFSFAEIGMQLTGFFIGSAAGRIAGEAAAWSGFVILAILGVFMTRESFVASEQRAFSAHTGWGLVVASLSISLDSLGIGFSMPSLHLPVAPLMSTVACTTVLFTLTGLALGARLGERMEKAAERSAGIVLILLAIFFAYQHARGFA